MRRFLTGEALRQVREQVAMGMRAYARNRPWDGCESGAVPDDYRTRWCPPGSGHGTGLLVAFWRTPDGHEHLVLKAARRPPRQRTITGWRRAFWPEHSDRELEIEEDGAVVTIRTVGPCR